MNNDKKTPAKKRVKLVPAYSAPEWTRPSFLNADDHEALVRVWESYNAGDYKAAANTAAWLDTIVREEIPADLYYHMTHEAGVDLVFWPEPYKTLYNK